MKLRTPRDHHWKQMFKKESYLEEERKCKYCKTHLKYSETTADHVVPRSKGGKTVRENIVASCYDCNQAKRSMSDSEFLSLIKKPPQPGIPFVIMLAWSRRKIAVQTERSCKNLERMFIGVKENEYARKI